MTKKKCNHKWVFAGKERFEYGTAMDVFYIFYCEKCGEIKKEIIKYVTNTSQSND